MPNVLRLRRFQNDSSPLQGPNRVGGASYHRPADPQRPQFRGCRRVTRVFGKPPRGGWNGSTAAGSAAVQWQSRANVGKEGLVVLEFHFQH